LQVKKIHDVQRIATVVRLEQNHRLVHRIAPIAQLDLNLQHKQQIVMGVQWASIKMKSRKTTVKIVLRVSLRVLQKLCHARTAQKAINRTLDLLSVTSASLGHLWPPKVHRRA